MQVAVNGRYAIHRVTGMQRYAREIVSRLEPRLTVVKPRRSIRGIRGHLWEQVVLPLRLGKMPLWSPCATGPLAVRSQVVTIHDCAFFDQAACFSRGFAAWYQWLVPRLAQRASAIITISRFSRDRIVEFCRVSEQKIAVIYNGVDGRFRPQEPADIATGIRPLSLPRPYVLCVGSLEPRKNLRRLLAAWTLLAREYPDVWLVLAGSEGKVFNDAGLREMPPRVHLTGYLGDESLPAVYAGAELFVFPSIYEGFGLPVIEAMACGTPVVCSGTTALAEIAGGAAELVNPHEVECIAEGMRCLLNDTRRRNSLIAAGIAQSQKFSWDSAAEAVWRVLRSATA
jgi:glycosyltransferase involved in cell wall biosynthesis